MKKLLFLFLLTFTTISYSQTTLANKLKITANITDNTASKVNVQDATGLINTIPKLDLIDVLEYASAINLPITGVSSKIYVTIDNKKLYRWNGTIYQELASTNILGKENIENKQNDLTPDGTGTKYPTVDAVNTGLGLKENILNDPITGVGSQNNANTYALQDGTILYHSVKWFIPTSTVSTNGTTVTSVGTQFTSAMVGAKLTINGEWRIITAFTSTTVVTVASAYSQNYSGVVAGSWGCYSRCSSITSTGNVYYYSYQGVVMFAYISSDQFNVRFSGFSMINNEVSIQPAGALLRDSAKILWSNNATYYGTKDLGLRRNSAGVLEIYDGIAATGLEANRRDLLARNLFGSKVLIGSIVDDNVNQGQYTGTVSSGTTALNNTPPIANNQLTRKDYVDTGLALKANLASPSLTGTPTAPTAAPGTNTEQIATTAFVAGGLATKENAFTKNTAFNKNFGTTAGTVVEGGTLGSNAYTSTAYLPLSGGDLSGLLKITRDGHQLSLTGSDQGAIDLYKSGTLGHRLFSDISNFGIYDLAANVTIFSISKSTGAANFSSSVTATSFNGSATLTGTPTAPTAPAGTNTEQIATTAFVTDGIATADSQNVKLTGDQTISGQKNFSSTGKIGMYTNNAFPAISVTTSGSIGRTAAEFINSSSFPNSSALRVQTHLSGGVGNMGLIVDNYSPIGTGIVSNSSEGGVSISSQSGNGDSYVSNITSGGTGRNYVGRNNGTETYSVDKTGSVTAKQYKISALNTAPASATATGTLGEIRITAGFIYVCIATNTWVRAALTTWI